jgi:hypothetical protein
MAVRRFEDEHVGMENKKVSPVINRTRLEGRPEFNVVLAYDEIAGAMRAKECFDDLTRLHGELYKFKCQLWNFDVMREPELFEAAVQDASRAEMVVITTRRGEAVSGHARRWIERWLLSKDAGPDAVLVLLSEKVAGAGSARGRFASLRQIVEGCGVAFLSKEIEWPAMESRFAVKITEGPRREEARQAAPVASTNAGQLRWGLNE